MLRFRHTRTTLSEMTMEDQLPRSLNRLVKLQEETHKWNYEKTLSRWRSVNFRYEEKVQRKLNIHELIIQELKKELRPFNWKFNVRQTWMKPKPRGIRSAAYCTENTLGCRRFEFRLRHCQRVGLRYFSDVDCDRGDSLLLIQHQHIDSSIAPVRARLFFISSSQSSRVSAQSQSSSTWIMSDVDFCTAWIPTRSKCYVSREVRLATSPRRRFSSTCAAKSPATYSSAARPTGTVGRNLSTWSQVNVAGAAHFHRRLYTLSCRGHARSRSALTLAFLGNPLDNYEHYNFLR